MLNKNHKTHPRFGISAKLGRLVFKNGGAESLTKGGETLLGDSFQVKSLPQFYRELKKRRKKVSDIASITRNGKDKTETLKNNLTKLWVGDKVTFKKAELIQKENVVVEAAKRATTKLAEEVELRGKAQKCGNTKTQTAASIVAELVGAEAEKIKEVTVKKKGGAKVELKRKGNDFVALEGKFQNKHFPIYEGDIVIIGHDIFSADQVDQKTGKKIPVEWRQTEEAVKAGLEGPSEDNLEKSRQTGKQALNKALETKLGMRRADETEMVEKITEIGIRRACKNFFVGEHGALAGVFLSEKQKQLNLFDKNGELKEVDLDKIVKVVVAKAGEVKGTNKNEVKADAVRLLGETGLFVGVPTLISALAAVITSARFAVVGYFPLAYIDIGRGIRKGKLEKFDRGDVKLLTDIAILDGEIMAAGKLEGGAVELEKQKRKLELLAIVRKEKEIEELLKTNLDEKIKEKLENDLTVLEKRKEKYKNVVAPTDEDLKKYSSEAVFVEQNKDFQEMKKAAKDLKELGVHENLDEEKRKAAAGNVEKNREAIKKSLAERQDSTERLRVWYERWFGGDIENPEEAVWELDGMIEKEFYGMNQIESRLKYRVNLRGKAGFVLKNILGIEKGRSLTRKTSEKVAEAGEQSFLEILALAQNPAGGKLPQNLKERLATIKNDENLEKILKKFRKYFTTNKKDFTFERNENRRRLAETILKNGGMSLAEKVGRLAVIASLKNIDKIDKQLTLKTNIENDQKIRAVLEDLKKVLETRGFLAEFKKNNLEFAAKMDAVFADAEWIEQKIDLKNFKNASLHAEIDDTLEKPIEEIAKYSATLLNFAENGIDDSEKDKIEEVINRLEKELSEAKQTVEKLLEKDAKEVRESHRDEAVEGIRNPKLKELNSKFEFAPITDEALPDGEVEVFTELAESLLGEDGKILKIKENFRQKMVDGFTFEGKPVKLENYEFYEGSETATSNLPMVSPENIDGLSDDAKKLQLARFLNSLILNVEQAGKDVAGTIYENIGERARMHVRDAELAATVGNAEWISETELKEKLKGYVSNTGQENTEDLNHFIAGEHPGGKFGGAYRFEFKRRISVDGQEFEITYNMLARGKCFNAVFVSDGGIKRIGKPAEKLDSLIFAELAEVKRRLFLLGIPLFFKVGGGEEGCLGDPYIKPVDPPPDPPPII